MDDGLGWGDDLAKATAWLGRRPGEGDGPAQAAAQRERRPGVSGRHAANGGFMRCVASVAVLFANGRPWHAVDGRDRTAVSRSRRVRGRPSRPNMSLLIDTA